MLKIKIKTPTKVIFTGDADSITLPTKIGEIQILQNHSNLITMLDIGLIKINEPNPTTFFCINGIAKIKDNTVSVLTEEALKPQEEVLKEIQQALKSAQEGRPTSNILAKDLIRAEKQLRYYLLKDKSE